MLVDLPDEFVAKIRKMAAKDMDWENPEFEVNDYAAGNIDDAYARGEDQGELSMAREIAAYFPKED